jgi:hypothetical protein
MIGRKIKDRYDNHIRVGEVVEDLGTHWRVDWGPNCTKIRKDRVGQKPKKQGPWWDEPADAGPTVRDGTSSWPPEAIRPDALGQLYNEAYARALGQGRTAEDAHQVACFAVHRHGYEYATTPARPSARRGHGQGMCTCDDASCLSVETRAVKEEARGGS